MFSTLKRILGITSAAQEALAKGSLATHTTPLEGAALRLDSLELFHRAPHLREAFEYIAKLSERERLKLSGTVQRRFDDAQTIDRALERFNNEQNPERRVVAGAHLLKHLGLIDFGSTPGTYRTRGEVFLHLTQLGINTLESLKNLPPPVAAPPELSTLERRILQEVHEAKEKTVAQVVSDLPRQIEAEKIVAALKNLARLGLIVISGKNAESTVIVTELAKREHLSTTGNT